MLKKYVEDNRLVRIRKGLYTLHGDLPDEYVALQIRSAKAIFSYGTALYFWGLSDRTPHFIDMTVPQGTNISTIKRDYPQARFHYVMSAMYSIGITETTSPQGLSLIHICAENPDFLPACGGQGFWRGTGSDDCGHDYF